MLQQYINFMPMLNTVNSTCPHNYLSDGENYSILKKKIPNKKKLKIKSSSPVKSDVKLYSPSG